MSCPRCKAAMLATPVLGGMAWTCPSEGCGWFVVAVLDNKANNTAAKSARFALGGRSRAPAPNPNPPSARHNAQQEAR